MNKLYVALGGLASLVLLTPGEASAFSMGLMGGLGGFSPGGFRGFSPRGFGGVRGVGAGGFRGVGAGGFRGVGAGGFRGVGAGGFRGVGAGGFRGVGAGGFRGVGAGGFRGVGAGGFRGVGAGGYKPVIGPQNRAYMASPARLQTQRLTTTGSMQNRRGGAGRFSVETPIWDQQARSSVRALRPGPTAQSGKVGKVVGKVGQVLGA